MKKIILSLIISFVAFNHCYAERFITTHDDILESFKIADEKFGGYIPTSFFFERFKENEIKYEQDLIGKILVFGGKVEKVRKAYAWENGSWVVELKIDTQFAFSNMEIVFPSDLGNNGKSKLANLKKGDVIRVVGKLQKKFTVDAFCYQNEKGEIDIDL